MGGARASGQILPTLSCCGLALRGVQDSKSKSDFPDHFEGMFAKIGEPISSKFAGLIYKHLHI